MVKTPQLIIADDLTKIDWPLHYFSSVTEDGCSYIRDDIEPVLARPPYSATCVCGRLILAWRVFTGQYDALKWRGGQ